MQTALSLSVGGMPPMSARGCVQELHPIAQGEFCRTINGDLMFVGPKSHKYRSIIRCADQNPLATDGLTIGEEVLVGCIQALCQRVAAGQSARTIALERPCVPGSAAAVDETNRPIAVREVDASHVEVGPCASECFVSYAPILRMRITNMHFATDEWKMQTKWQLELEEI